MLPLFAGRDPMICGFASTEPGCGSAMSSMSTTYEQVDGGYRIRGQKHWQGFSSTAHWWLVGAKNDTNGRRYGYFIVKRSEGFRTVQRYEPLGMRVLDYGAQRDPRRRPGAPQDRRRGPNLSGMVEMLMPPRAMMAALACGFLRRITREARAYADSRPIGPAPLSAIRFARYRLMAIETLIHDLHSAQPLPRDRAEREGRHDRHFPAVQAIRTVATERMVSSAHHYQQLVGGDGYRCDSPTNIAGLAFLDTRVFTIFDGTNDLLSQQLTDFCLARRGGRSLSDFLANWPLTAGVAAHHLDLRFLGHDLKQEHLVLGGRAIARVFAISQVMRWTQETQGDAAAGRAGVAIEFLEADIDGIAREFALLAQGVLDDGDGDAARSAGVVPSRSLPVPAAAEGQLPPSGPDASTVRIPAPSATVSPA